MAQYIRSNAWNNGGTFNNTDLLWYAKGVGLMMTRQLNDPSSWWFYAAIHGEYLNESGFPGWGSIPAPPAVPTTPVPPPNVQQMYWDQCQHQSWYFPPWHRGYLIALEAQIRAAVMSARWAVLVGVAVLGLPRPEPGRDSAGFHPAGAARRHEKRALRRRAVRPQQRRQHLHPRAAGQPELHVQHHLHGQRCEHAIARFRRSADGLLAWWRPERQSREQSA